MLTRRIIPCMDVTAGRVVKGVKFENLRDAGDPVEIAARYNEAGADELCFLDITATSDGRDTIYALVEATARRVFIPLTVGGGIRELSDMRRLLDAGADKGSVNSAAFRDPELVQRGAQAHGSQFVVAAIDARRVTDYDPARVARDVGHFPALPEHVCLTAESRFEAYVRGGRTATGVDAVRWARYMAEQGAGEILLTSMDADGTKAGYDLELTRAVADAVPVPVIASGGVGALEHFVAGFRDAHADACLAASVFHFGQLTVGQVKDACRAAGIAMRPAEAGHRAGG